MWLAPKIGVWVFGCTGLLDRSWRFGSCFGSPRFGGVFWYLGPASCAVFSRMTDRKVVDVPPGARVGAESGMQWRIIRSDTLVTTP